MAAINAVWDASTILTTPNDYSDQIQNTLKTADQIATINAGDYWFVGFFRPVQGVKFYVDTVNTTASSMYANEWNGTAWAALTVTDGTAVAGKSLSALFVSA